MDWLYENWLPSLIAGGLTTAILIGGWIQTGQKWLLYVALAAVLLTAGAIALEVSVVTDREQIHDTLSEIAALVEDNRIEQALDYAWSEAPEVRQQAQAELPLYEFESVEIKRNLKIEVFPNKTPPRATAEFNVVVVLSTRTGLVQGQRIPRFLEVDLVRDDEGRWRVAGYQHYDPRRGWTDEELLP